jgi:hypothetical protein
MTYANVLLTLALVFAMTGGAYAAKKYLITSTKQISPSVLKALAGKPGPAGPAGKTGVPGAPGKDGAQGPKGDTGSQGLEGKEGPQGKEGKQGIQGIQGEKGQDGSPWTAGGTLPPGKTETGVVARLALPAVVFSPISFNIPLPDPIEESHVKIVAAEGTPPDECSDGVAPAAGVSHPEADPGYFCFFVAVGETPGSMVNIGSASGATYEIGTTGFIVFSESTLEATWAVTAP